MPEPHTAVLILLGLFILVAAMVLKKWSSNGTP